MIDDIQYIREQFCKYNCTAKMQEIDVSGEDTWYCGECADWKYVNFDTSVTLGEELCRICPINDFIRELQSNKILK